MSDHWAVGVMNTSEQMMHSTLPSSSRMARTRLRSGPEVIMKSLAMFQIILTGYSSLSTPLRPVSFVREV